MKAMLWKEWRENIKWAVLAMIALGLAEFYGLLQRNPYTYNDDAQTLCKPSFLMITTFGSAAVGIILGLIQILPEQRRDQWAALLHRPVTRATIFRGKAFAGLGLYLLATIPPFLACIWYVATPGHFSAPLEAGMVCPGVADICAGAMYYFAALFVGLRRGFWFGSRAFGFLAALVASFYITGYLTLFRLPVEAAVLMALLLFTAGWGAILTNGTMRGQPWLGRFSLVAVIYYGVCGLISLLVLGLGMFSGPNYYYGTEYQMDLDGRPIVVVASKTAGTKITDLAGNVIKDEHLNSGARYNYVLFFASVSGYIGDPHQIKLEDSTYSEGYRQNQTYLTQAGGKYDSETERWYFLPQKKQYVGYFFKTNQRIGAIGQNGFTAGYEKREPFAGRLTGYYEQINTFTQFGQTVYYNEFDQRKVVPVFSQPGAELFGAAPLTSYQDRTLGDNLGAVALIDKMTIIDKTGRVVATLPYHQNMDRWGSLSVAMKPTKDRFFLRYAPSTWLDYEEQRKMPGFIEEMDAAGTLYHTYTLPPVPLPSFPQSWPQYIEESLEAPAFFYGDLVYDKIGGMCGSKRLADDFHGRMTRGWGYTKEIAIRITVVSFVLALVTLAWARRAQMTWRRAWAWAAFVFGLNFAGLITFRLAADWPVRVRCPKCQGLRLVQEETCSHCHTPWPAPAREGIEIFDEGSRTAELAPR